MANLNLSEFTEKLFVADADHTFIWDTAASISKRVSRNSWLSGTTADFHLGLADAASPVAQTISVQSVVAGTTNTAGANLSINGSQGTGTGAGGSLLLRTAPAGSSGTAQNALVTAVAITSAGNVGIGTTAPGSTLTVAGTFHFGSDNGALPGGTSYGGHMGATSFFALRSNNSASTSLYLQNTGGGSKNAEFRLLGSGAGADFGAINLRTIESSPITFDTNITEKMRITAAGNVGIGTTSPTSKLHVALNPAANYTTETVRFGNIHFANGTGGYSNLWMGSISTPLTLSASNYTLANDGTNTIINGGSGGLFFHVGAAAHWNIQSTGHLLCSSDNSRDIGASGANRPRNVYAGSSFQSGSGNAGGLYIGAFGGVTSFSNGVFTWWNNTVNNFDRFQLGGTTDVFPAIARDGAGIKFTGAAAGSTAWIKVPPVAVSALPLAATAGAGARAFVNDALAPTFGSAVTGGGAVLVPVYSDGSAWNVG